MTTAVEAATLLEKHIKLTPDWPKPGVLFRDVLPLLYNPADTWAVMAELTQRIQATVGKPDVVVGIESRGFLFGPLLADLNAARFVPIRKAGKLPPPVYAHEYLLEYGEDQLELATDAITPGARVVTFDDVLATGGTLNAAQNLLTMAGADLIAHAVLIDLHLGAELAAPVIAIKGM